jgi:hypothetical protein
MSDKVCPRCGEARPVEQFWRDARKPGGREKLCCVCRSLRRAQRLGRTQTPRKNSPWLRELLPALARRLSALLHGEDAPPCRMELIPVNVWHRAMQLICEGTSPEGALRRAKIPRHLFDAHLRYEPRLAAWFARAKRASRHRRWPGVLEMDELLSELIRTPGMSARTACQHRGINYRGFILRSKTPEWEDRFLRIKALQRDRSFGALAAELEALGDGVTRATRRSMAQRVHELKRLEPRRYDMSCATTAPNDGT